VKECYEPFFSDLIATTPISSIWIADSANQGASYALNAPHLGDDPSWFDHSLDLLLMLNTYRERMKPPFIGIAHSFGCAQLTHLSSIHPRLFHSLILIDPILQKSHPPGPNSALFSSKRRDVWPSRALAETQIRANPFFEGLDARCMNAFLAYALRDKPDGSVVLSTPKAQEAWSYVRCNMFDISPDTPEGRARERMLNPDVEPFSEPSRLVTMRPELVVACDELPHLRPNAFYVYGEYSFINFDDMREAQVSSTGTGRGGNGGVKEGAVKDLVLEDCGHLCVFEKPLEIAESVSMWLEKEVGRWKEESEFWATADTRKSKNGQGELSNRWLEVMKADTSIERPRGEGKAKL
jgi:pimeloyl-ACP methyl ester carboxylesterase